MNSVHKGCLMCALFKMSNLQLHVCPNWEEEVHMCPFLVDG